MDNTESPKKRRGCFFYGCITSLILLLLIVVGGFIAFRFVVNKANALIMEYTETQPMVLEKSTLPPAELDQLKNRVKAFNDALDAGTTAPLLTLSDTEINALLASSPQLGEFKDRIFVTIESNAINAQVSLPVDQLHVPILNTKGRYLNGNGVFKAAIVNGNLSISFDSLDVKGKPLPKEFLDALKNQNIAQSVTQNPKNAAAINKLDSLEVKDGKIIIQGKKSQ